MKLIKMLVLILVILGLVYFLMNNNDEATVNLLFKQTDQTAVANIILASFGVGLVIGFLMAVTSILSAKNASRVLRSKNKKLVDELNHLRNVHIEEEPTSTDTIQEA